MKIKHHMIISINAEKHLTNVNIHSWLKTLNRGLSGGSVLKDLPGSAGDVRDDPTYFTATKPVCHNYWDCALEPRNPNRWGPPAPQPVLCKQEAALQEESPATAVESSPCSSQLEESPGSNQDPAQPQTNK